MDESVIYTSMTNQDSEPARPFPEARGQECHALALRLEEALRNCEELATTLESQLLALGQDDYAVDEISGGALLDADLIEASISGGSSLRMLMERYLAAPPADAAVPFPI